MIDASKRQTALQGLLRRIPLIPEPEPPKKRPRVARSAGFAIVGVVAGYFFHPQDGKRRRTMTRDRTMAPLRRLMRRGKQFGRYEVNKISSVGQRMTHMGVGDIAPNDPTVKAKVETALFGMREIDTSRININVED